MSATGFDAEAGQEFPKKSPPFFGAFFATSFRKCRRPRRHNTWMGTTDLEWLTRIVAERAAGLVLYARQWLDAATADDVVQEALVALLAERYPPANPAAWMYRAVRNAAIDTVRSTSRRRRREQAVAATRSEWFETRPDALIDAQAAQEALERLSSANREIVVLRIWGGLGFAEIADVTQLAVSTVHERYGKAIHELRRELEKPCKTKLD